MSRVVVNEIQAKVGNDISLYALSFTSSELVKNQRTRVNKSLRGSFSEIVKEKIEKNARKYPIEKCKGSSRKYKDINSQN